VFGRCLLDVSVIFLGFPFDQEKRRKATTTQEEEALAAVVIDPLSI